MAHFFTCRMFEKFGIPNPSRLGVVWKSIYRVPNGPPIIVAKSLTYSSVRIKRQTMGGANIFPDNGTIVVGEANNDRPIYYAPAFAPTMSDRLINTNNLGVLGFGII